MNTIEIGGNEYRIGKLDAMKQFHITRRLTPLLAASGERLLSSGESGDDFVGVVVALSEALARMSDADAEFVIDTCLATVQRKVIEGKYQPVRTGGRWLYEDIDMQTMMRLTVEVIKENLGDFFGQLSGALGLPLSALSFAPPQDPEPKPSA